jgi:hypothetical protein
MDKSHSNLDTTNQACNKVCTLNKKRWAPEFIKEGDAQVQDLRDRCCEKPFEKGGCQYKPKDRYLPKRKIATPRPATHELFLPPVACVGFAKGREHGSQSGKGSITSIEKKEIKALGKFAFLPHVRVNPTSSTKFISPKILYLVTS